MGIDPREEVVQAQVVAEGNVWMKIDGKWWRHDNVGARYHVMSWEAALLEKAIRPHVCCKDDLR